MKKVIVRAFPHSSLALLSRLQDRQREKPRLQLFLCLYPAQHLTRPLDHCVQGCELTRQLITSHTIHTQCTLHIHTIETHTVDTPCIHLIPMPMASPLPHTMGDRLVSEGRGIEKNRVRDVTSTLGTTALSRASDNTSGMTRENLGDQSCW